MTSPGALITARGLSKLFRLYDRPRDRLFEWLSFGTRTNHESFWALRGADVEVRAGECLGIIGRNGSGKSTLLKLMSGALVPTEGRVNVSGRVYALLELGTGFNKQLTGRQNIAHAGAMLGLPKGYIKEREAQIIAFADLGRFIDVPVRSYSSGMMSRLAFSLFAFLDPDVLMIDEVLSVGDEAFKARCFDLIGERVAQGRGVVFVSHALRTMVRLCDRVLWLEDGEIVGVGDPTEMVNAFVERHKTTGGAETNVESAARREQSAAPSADVIVPELVEVDDPTVVPDGSCVWVRGADSEDEESAAGVHVRRVWLESPLGDLRDNAPAGLSFVIAAELQGAGDEAVPIDVSVSGADGSVIGGVRARIGPRSGGARVLRLLCGAGLSPGVHTLWIGSGEASVSGVEGAAFSVIGTAPTPGGLVLFRRLTLHGGAGD